VSRVVSQQVYYSLLMRDIENELVPLAVDQILGILLHTG
jgi:aryl-alcohol dehydrogenase-like predicted oxidoreductase